MLKSRGVISPLVFSMLVLLLAILSCYGNSAQAQEPLTVENLQELIDEAGYQWTAAETSVSKLSEEDLQRLCGVRPEVAKWEKQQASLQETPVERSYAYPSSLDWRNNGGNFTTSIRDQGQCGSCVAFRANGSIESRVEGNQNNPNSNPDLSEAQLFSCGGGDCDDGIVVSTGLDFARDTGVVDEACLPYPAGGSGADEIWNQKCSDWASRATKIAHWQGVTAASDMKQASHAGTGDRFISRRFSGSEWHCFNSSGIRGTNVLHTALLRPNPPDPAPFAVCRQNHHYSWMNTEVYS